ncbi:MAG: di-heme oxidoredictase family protein [Bacteroidota bacterium]
MQYTNYHILFLFTQLLPLNSRRVTKIGLLFISLFIVSCQEDPIDPETVLEDGEEYSGGFLTTFDAGIEAFNKPAPGLSLDNFNNFQVGNSFFRSAWVPSPASTTARDGVGPLMNAVSCTGCHVRDGRGRPPMVGESVSSLLFRLSIPEQQLNGAPVPDPTYGGQFQTKAIRGFEPEGNVDIFYTEMAGNFPDGTPYYLRRPTYLFQQLSYGDMDARMLFSPRVAPGVYGLGLLEAIPELALMMNADPNDADGDGISGRPNYVWDFADEEFKMGRFGWKANQPHLRQQNAGAFNGDMGLTSSIFPETDCTDAQGDCQEAPNGGHPEITDEMLGFVTIYTRALGVPVRRNWDDPQVVRGKELFLQANCGGCHVPSYELQEMPGFPEYGPQTIRPYTDLLLHDMGEGLADQRPDYEATGSEWRTPPLWGIGLVETINGHTNFLHDGRARNLTEAILWHDGEASQSKTNFMEMSKEDRAALIAFLESL